MSRISLRNWLGEIEAQLAAGEAELALPRCRRAVEILPRCLAIYRLLGRAELQCGHYSQSADIFLRLLSSLPDDFTAHLALSLIRESEGKQDAAAWHIERASEARPGSQALRAEAARLLVLHPQPKDTLAGGTSILPQAPASSTRSSPGGSQPEQTPPVPRLTRAALARLYFQGRCYPQAIAELDVAIYENPERLDLPVLLAQVYFAAGQAEQAAAASRAVLQKLPFSLYANQVAFLVATQAGQAEQALPFRQRLQELDPYWAYVTPAVLDVDRLPDHAVMLDNL